MRGTVSRNNEEGIEGDPVLDAARLVLQVSEDTVDAIPIQAVMIVVGMGSDGEKWISHFRSDDLRTWEARGLVEDLRDTLAAMEMRRMFNED